MEKITIMKNKNNPFVMLLTSSIEDPNLSWKAKGLWAYLLSRPDNWIIRMADLVKRSKDKKTAVYSALGELQKNGYATRKDVRDSRGRYTGCEYIIYEAPLSGFLHPDTLKTEKPNPENQTHNNKHTNKNNFLNSSDSGSTQNENNQSNCVLETYQKEIGIITPIIREKLFSVIDQYGADCVYEAIVVAVNNGVRNMAYLEGVLKRKRKGVSRGGTNTQHRRKVATAVDWANEPDSL